MPAKNIVINPLTGRQIRVGGATFKKVFPQANNNRVAGCGACTTTTDKKKKRSGGGPKYASMKTGDTYMKDGEKYEFDEELNTVDLSMTPRQQQANERAGRQFDLRYLNPVPAAVEGSQNAAWQLRQQLLQAQRFGVQSLYNPSFMLTAPPREQLATIREGGAQKKKKKSSKSTSVANHVTHRGSRGAVYVMKHGKRHYL